MSVSLEELRFRTSYHKGEDDIAGEFYLPCMRRSTRYDRAVGFFRSSIFALSWPALRQFVANRGRIRFVCSQVLSDEDVEALNAGYAHRVDELLEQRQLTEIEGLLEDPDLWLPTRILAGLVAGGILDFRIAVLRSDDLKRASGRIFHDKLGIFRDVEGHAVMFKGSMNETWNGLSADGNMESIDVAATWLGERDRQRVAAESSYFERLWDDTYPGLTVRPFPEVARDELCRSAPADWEALLDEGLERNLGGGGHGKTLRAHQKDGLDSWDENGRRGILAFATGSGKTFTAVKALEAAIWEHGDVAVVVAPDTVLFEQWDRELTAELGDREVRFLRAGAGHVGWKRMLRDWTAPAPLPRVVLATLDTAASADFLNTVTPGEHLCLVVDEVHRAGSPYRSALLDGSRFKGARLGLSATPERAGDPVGTAKILEFFDGILKPRYSLPDAINDGVLCRYFYRPWPVTLDEDEVAAWEELSGKIGRLMAARAADEEIPEQLKHLLIQRARIVKKAAGKAQLARRVLSELYESGQRWLVYCDDLDQLHIVQRSIEELGLPVVPFHSAMEGDRDGTLRWLATRGGVVVAIRCLDEGVDIPGVTHALILASSQNPREFVQRRGRVLRKAAGKSLAYIHDAIVVPPRAPGWDRLSASEIARAVEFASNADNPAGAAEIKALAIEMGIDLSSAARLGIEVEDESD